MRELLALFSLSAVRKAVDLLTQLMLRVTMSQNRVLTLGVVIRM